MTNINVEFTVPVDIREKLSFGHTPTQRQVLVKLHDQIDSHVQTLKCLITTKNAKDCQALLILQDLMGHKDLNIGRIASGLLLSLTKKKCVCPSLFVSSAITLSALQRPIQNFMNDLLRILTEEDDSQLSSLTTLTRIYSSQNKDPTILFNEIQNFLLLQFEKEICLRKPLTVLEPFFVYILSKPQHAPGLVEMLLQTESILQCTSNNGGKSVIFSTLVKAVGDNVVSKTNWSTNLMLVMKLVVWHFDRSTIADERIQIVVLLSSQIWNCYKHDEFNNIQQATLLLKTLVETEEVCMFEQAILLMCSMMLLSVYDEVLKVNLLEIILDLLPKMAVDEIPPQTLKIVSSFLVLPLLQIFSDKTTIGVENPRSLTLAKNIFLNVQNILSMDVEMKSSTSNNVWNDIHTDISKITMCTIETIQLIVSDKESCLTWLDDLMNYKKVVEKNIVLMLSSTMLFHYQNEQVFQKCLQSVLAVCKGNPVLVSQFLPFLMYLLNDGNFKEVKIHILYIIPNLAVGKMLISPVLKFLTLLSTKEELMPVALQLMTSLWLKQPRTFPYLLSMINKEINNRTSKVWFDIMISKATCVLKICKLKATQYGQDMVVLLSNMMESLIDVDVSPFPSENINSVTSALAMIVEALRLLCLAEVVDIQSVWKAVVLKVQKKKTLVINKSLCSLCSVIPIVCGDKRQDLVDEALEYLWYLVQDEKDKTACHAFEALASFHPSHMKIKFLPKEIASYTCHQMISHKEHKEHDETFDPLQEPIPGYAYAKLLKSLAPDAMPGFKSLLRKVLETEINALPRGVGRRSLMKPSQSMTSSIPNVLRDLYETSTRPGILPGVAAGLLSCYEPQIRGMDLKNPEKKHLKAVMERYKQMLNSVLQDYTINSNEWAHVLSTPKLWCAFMTQVYSAFIEGRIADLEIQHEKGETSDQSIFEEEIVVAKYWARDQITNQLRTASKGNPKVQGNSIYALAGLANSVFAHENENIRKEECHQYVNMRHWLLKVADTIHVIFDGNATLPGKPFQWCQQVSSDRSTASSFISRCAAAVCLADLVRPLLPLDANRIMEMLKGLRDRCPRQIKAGTSSILHFYTCIGYGMFLSRIQHTQFAGALTSSNEDFKVEEYMDVFKNILDRNNIEGREAAVIGYTCALSSALLNKKKDDCKHVFTYYESLHRNVSRYSQDDLTTLEAQACCFSLATLTIPLYNNSSIDVERVKEIHQLLKAHADKAPQASDIYLSLGLMNNLILRSNITTHIEDVKQMLKTWEISFTESNLPILKKLGIVKGVMATCGCLNILYEGDLQEVPETNEMKSVFKKIIRNLENSNDVLISLVSARLNGELYLSNSSKARLSSQLPPSYSYLGETSTLSSVVNVLQEKGIYDEKEIVLIFDVLSSIQCPTLPPINWTSLLTKYFQAEFSDKVKYSCIAFALKFTSTCMDLSLWLSSFIQASPFMNLSHEIQLAIFSHTSTILNALSNSKQKFLLQDLPLVALNNTSMISEILCSVLQMWLSVADMPVPIQSSYTYIYEGLMKLINNIDNYEQHFKDDICETFAKLLERVSPKHWHKMISVMREELQIYITIKFLRHSDSIVSTNLMQLLGKLGKQENEEFLRMFLEAISGFRDNKKKMAELNHFHIQLMQSILEKKIVSMAYKITSNFLGNLCHDETDGEVTWFIPPISGFRDGKMFLRLQTIFEILY